MLLDNQRYKNKRIRKMGRKINIIENLDGKKTVLIQDTMFKGRRAICWDDVEKYLEQYIDDIYTIAETGEEIYIGSELPSEYTGSVYTRSLKGGVAKAKANAAQGIPELIEIATNQSFDENRKHKHRKDAKYGWYRYDTRFAIPVFDEKGEIERYNVFKALILIRHAENGKKISL